MVNMHIYHIYICTIKLCIFYLYKLFKFQFKPRERDNRAYTLFVFAILNRIQPNFSFLYVHICLSVHPVHIWYTVTHVYPCSLLTIMTLQNSNDRN